MALTEVDVNDRRLRLTTLGVTAAARRRRGLERVDDDTLTIHPPTEEIASDCG